MQKIFFFCFTFFIIQGTFSQNNIRFVVPIGHQDYVNNHFISRDSSFIYTTEDSLFIVWDLPSKKEIFRKNIHGGENFNELVYENLDKKELVFNNNGILRKINFEENSTETIDLKPYTKGIQIENTSLYLTKNNDSISLYDLKSFQFVAKFQLNFNDISRWHRSLNQSGTYVQTQFFLVKPKDGQHCIIVYNPMANLPIQQINFEYNIRRAFLVNDTHLLIQKDTLISQKEKINMLLMDLNTAKVTSTIPFHKYAINCLKNTEDGGLISTGNDGRLVFWDKNLEIKRELNVKKQFNLPSFVYIDLNEETLNFNAIRKKVKPFETTDSVVYKGSIDLTTLQLIHVDTIRENVKLKADSFENDDNTADFLFGEDQYYNYYSNKDQEITLTTYLDTTYSQIARISEDFHVLFEKVETKSILGKYSSTHLLEERFEQQFEKLSVNQQKLIFEDLIEKSQTSNFLVKEFIEEIQLHFFAQIEKHNRIEKGKWRVHSSTVRIDSLDIYSFSDSVYYGKKLVLTDSYHQYDSISRSNLKMLGKNVFLFSKIADDSIIISYLNKRKVVDQITINDFYLDYIHTNYFLFIEEMPPIPFKSFDTQFIDFPNTNSAIPYFIHFPGHQIKFENSKKKDEFYVRKERFWKLDIESNEIKYDFIDTIYKVDYLEQNPHRYVYNSYFNLVFYDYLNQKMTLNPRSKDLQISIQKNSKTFNYFLPTTKEFFNVEILNYFNPYFSFYFNDINALLYLDYINENIQLTDFHFDHEKKSIFSMIEQKYYGQELLLKSNEEFIGFQPKKNLFIVRDHETNFFIARDLTNKNLFSFVLIDDSNYLFFDEHYRYDGTAGAISKLYLTCGLEVVELSQIKDALFVPNLVQRILNGENLNHLPKLDDLTICGVTPKVIPLKTNSNKIRYKIIPQNGGIGNIEIYINGVLRQTVKPENMLVQDGEFYLEVDNSLIEKYRIDNAPSEIKIIAKTLNDKFSSRGVRVVLEENETSQNRIPSIHALMIGVDSYKDNSLALNYAAKDANDLQRVLQAAAIKYFNIDDTNRVFFYNLTINRDGKNGTDNFSGITPDRENIIRTFDLIEKSSKPEDIILLFYAGHGEIVENDQLLLLTVESTKEEFQGIKIKEILEYMNKIPAGKRIMILDACHSGAAINNLDLAQITGKRDITDAERESQRKKELDKLASKSGFAILTASSSDQKALELPQYQHGVLTYCLLSALLNNNLSLNNQNQIILEKWFIATENEIQRLNTGQNSEKMVPISFCLGIVDEQIKLQIDLNELPVLYIDNVLNKETYSDNLLIKTQLNELFSENKLESKNTFLFGDYPNAIKLNMLYEQIGPIVYFTIKLENKSKQKVFNSQFDIQNMKSGLNEIYFEISNFMNSNDWK